MTEAALLVTVVEGPIWCLQTSSLLYENSLGLLQFAVHAVDDILFAVLILADIAGGENSAQKAENCAVEGKLAVAVASVNIDVD